jgi:hypothetical protein
VVLTNVLIREVYGRTGIYEVEFRGFNIRPTFLPAFIKQPLPKLQNGATREIGIEDTIRSLHDSATADDEGLVGFFDINDFPQPARGTDDAPQSLRSVVTNLLRGRGGWISVPAEDLAIAVIDGELGRVIYAPEPVTWPVLLPANTPVAEPDENRWKDIPGDDRFSNVPSVKQVVYEPPSDNDDNDDNDDDGDNGDNGDDDNGDNGDDDNGDNGDNGDYDDGDNGDNGDNDNGDDDEGDDGDNDNGDDNGDDNGEARNRQVRERAPVKKVVGSTPAKKAPAKKAAKKAPAKKAAAKKVAAKKAAAKRTQGSK